MKSFRVFYLFTSLLFISTAVFAGEIDSLVRKLVEKGILSPGEAQQIAAETKEEMKKEIVQAKSELLLQWVQTMKLKGDFRPTNTLSNGGLAYEYLNLTPAVELGIREPFKKFGLGLPCLAFFAEYVNNIAGSFLNFVARIFYNGLTINRFGEVLVCWTHLA